MEETWVISDVGIDEYSGKQLRINVVIILN